VFLIVSVCFAVAPGFAWMVFGLKASVTETVLSDGPSGD